MLHDMRSISEQKATESLDSTPETTYPTKDGAATASVEAILTEVASWVGELRCASMSRLVQSQVSMSQMHVLWLLQHHGAMKDGKWTSPPALVQFRNIWIKELN